MDSADFGTPLGYSAIQSRMQEISQKMGWNSVKFSPAESSTAPDFSTTLTGAIGGNSPLPGDPTPLSPFGPGRDVQGGSQYQSMIRQAAANAGVDPDLLTALVKQESSFSPTARSNMGAMGLTQLMPGTAQALGVTNPFDPMQSLNGGAKYLRQMLDQFGSVPTALAAYNAGPGAIVKHGGIPPYPETKRYVESILSHYSQLKRGQVPQ